MNFNLINVNSLQPPLILKILMNTLLPKQEYSLTTWQFLQSNYNVLINGAELNHIDKKFYGEATMFEMNKYNETTDSINAVLELLQDLPTDAMVSSFCIHSTSTVCIIKSACTKYRNRWVQFIWICISVSAVTACRLDNWGLFPDRNRDFCIYHLIQNGCGFQQFPMPWAPRTSFLQ